MQESGRFWTPVVIPGFWGGPNSEMLAWKKGTAKEWSQSEQIEETQEVSSDRKRRGRKEGNRKDARERYRFRWENLVW